MRLKLIIIALCFSACTETRREAESDQDSHSARSPADTSSNVNDEANSKALSADKKYSNTRFKDVTVQKVAANTYSVAGKGQIFEASFGWVVEDGHNELQHGFQMTEAGAPEWGNFRFSIAVEKQRTNSTLTLILYESSPKDGSRQYELPIALE